MQQMQTHSDDDSSPGRSAPPWVPHHTSDPPWPASPWNSSPLSSCALACGLFGKQQGVLHILTHDLLDLPPLQADDDPHQLLPGPQGHHSPVVADLGREAE